jgi:hypothetical protein
LPKQSKVFSIFTTVRRYTQLNRFVQTQIQTQICSFFLIETLNIWTRILECCNNILSFFLRQIRAFFDLKRFRSWWWNCILLFNVGWTLQLASKWNTT